MRVQRSSIILPKLILPLSFLFLALFIYLMPAPPISDGGVSVKTLRAPGFPILLALEHRQGAVTSAWLRSPAGTKNLSQLEGLSFITDSKFMTLADQDNERDLMWRLSFINFEGDGQHLWLAMTTWQPKLFIYTSPYQYTRWDAVPAKLVVPKGTAVFVSPATPSYNKAGRFNETDSYSFVYTVRMTPEGPSFVPIPDVYRQLAVLLKAGMKGEYSPMKRLAYVRMLNEFNSLAAGRPPQTDTILNFQMQKIDIMSWNK